MKYLWLVLAVSVASAQTYYDKTTIPPTGATNTVIGNKTNATAAPTYMAVGSCSTAASALIWTTNTGFGCNTAIDAATLLTGTWAAPGSIGSGTPAAGAFTTLSTTGAASFGAPLTISNGTSLSQASWGLAGIGFKIPAATYNDTTAGSGGVSQEAAYAITGPTITNTQGTANTLNTLIGTYFGLPVCGSGWAGCTNIYATFSAGQIGGIKGATVNGAAINLNVASNFAVNIGTSTTNATVTVGGGSNTVALNGSSVTIAGTTIGLTGATTNTGALNVTGLFTPAATQGIVGTTGADAPAAGSVGQVVSIHCVVAAPAAASTSVTVTVASPAVVTWSSHTFVPSSGLANYTCPINFLGTPPTGIVVGTNYFIIGSSVSGDTFQISDTPAHALAGTNAVNTTGSDGGTTARIGNLGGTGTGYSGAGMSLIAGDWDCAGLGEFQELTTLTTSRFAAGVNTAAAALGAIGTYTDNRTVSGAIGAFNEYTTAPVVQENISATTTVYMTVTATWTVGTMGEGAFLRCRRMR